MWRAKWIGDCCLDSDSDKEVVGDGKEGGRHRKGSKGTGKIKLGLYKGVLTVTRNRALDGARINIEIDRQLNNAPEIPPKFEFMDIHSQKRATCLPD